MKKNKKLIKRIGCLLGAFMVALVSICSIIPTKKQNIDYASADFYESTYVSNWVPLLVTLGTDDFGSVTTLGYYNVNGQLTFRNNSNGGIDIKISLISFDGTLSFYSDFVSLSVNGYDNWSARFWIKDISVNRYVYVSYSFDAGFYVPSLSTVMLRSGIGHNQFNVDIVYTDSALLRFGFAFPNSPTGSTTDLVRYKSDDPPIFPIVSPNSNTYAQGYSQGQSDGYYSGYNFGFADGKIEGDSIGYNRGYGIGYNDAVADSSDYTFLGLLSAVVDAPIQALTGLLNFEILGVNLMDFVTGLFTIAIILFVVKLIL